MTTRKPDDVLFLCTGNSARSILAEVLLNRIGKPRFRAFSAGSHPTGRVHPLALRILREAGESTEGLRSKSWNEFARVPLDFVVTVCGNAAGEECPLWPGRPITAHWGVDDPAAVDGDDEERLRAFRAAYEILERRIRRFVELPLDSLDAAASIREVRAIGER